MNKQEQLKSDKAIVAELEQEYKRVKEHTDGLRDIINDISFDDKVPEPQERYLLSEKLQTVEGYQTNLRNRIRFYRARIKAAEQNRQVCGDGIATQEHHCGQDAASQAEDGSAESPESLKDLLGMEVVCVGDMPCDGCPHDHYGAPCVKVELVGGYHICLAAHPNSIITE